MKVRTTTELKTVMCSQIYALTNILGVVFTVICFKRIQSLLFPRAEARTQLIDRSCQQTRMRHGYKRSRPFEQGYRLLRTQKFTLHEAGTAFAEICLKGIFASFDNALPAEQFCEMRPSHHAPSGQSLCGLIGNVKT